MSRRTRLLPRFYRYMLESDASTHRKGTALNVLSGLLTGVGLAIMMPPLWRCRRGLPSGV